MKYQRTDTIGACTIYLANCMDVVHHLPRKFACVSDPPYGVPIMTNFDFTRKGGRKNQGKEFSAVIGNDEEFDPAPFIHGPKDSNGIYSEGGFAEIVLWGANHFAHRLPHNGRWLVWDKRCGLIPERTQADGEVAWCNEYGALRIIRHVWDGMIKDSERGQERVHPTQKPVFVMEECLRHIKADTVVDPYMGSGTTGVACIKAGKAFVGIELDPKYYEAALKRLRAAYDSPDLFQPAPAKPVQVLMFEEEKPVKKKK